MRRFAVLAGGAGLALVLLACGGPSFTLSTAVEDAAVDAPSDVHEDAIPAGDASRGDELDGAGTPDVRDATVADAVVADAASDGIADAVEEPAAHCAGAFACAPGVPSGWGGPFEVYAGAAAPPACGADFTGSVLDGHMDLTAPAATCQCSCGASTGVECSSPPVTFYANSAACSLATSCSIVMLTPGACTPVDVSTPCGAALGVTMTLSRSVASQGSCAPVATTTVPTSSWATQARACGAPATLSRADCPAGSVCAPAPSGPFKATLCIEQPGATAACPATDYTSRAVYFGSIDDTRGCSACTCGAVTGASCTGSVTQFASADTTCANGQTIYPLGQSCDPVQQPAALQLALAASGGSCAPSSATATGAAAGANAMTFCCAP